MPIDFEKERVRFREMIDVTEAEGLLGWLQEHPAGSVDLAGCTHLHPANLQVLLAAGARIVTWPEDAGLRSWLRSVWDSGAPDAQE